MIYIRDAKRKMNIREASNWFSNNNTFTLIDCIRTSTKGKSERVFILGSGADYGIHKGMESNYIHDTGKGHGGKGKISITSVNLIRSGIILATDNIMEVNEKIRLPIWVMK